MNKNDTIDVPLHARISEKTTLQNGDDHHTIDIVCNGQMIAQLEVTLYRKEGTTPNDEAARDLIRRSVAACLMEAVISADDTDELRDIPDEIRFN